MMPLRRSFFKLFNDSMSGPRRSWTRAAFSVVEEQREKWEKHLPPHVPDKSRERQREGYGEKRSGVFYDIGACCSTAFKMLLTGSRWEEETQLELCGQDPLRDKLTNTHTNAHTDSVCAFVCVRTCNVVWGLSSIYSCSLLKLGSDFWSFNHHFYLYY